MVLQHFFLDCIPQQPQGIVSLICFYRSVLFFISTLIISAGTGWQAGTDDYYQSLTIRLDKRYNITSIGTLGRLDTKEFVSEYYILTSVDGDSWNPYKSADGHDEVLQLTTPP